jgi:WD40 repeat protein
MSARQLVALSFALTATAAAVEPPAPPSFARDVRPVLDIECAGCHQPARPRGGLDVTSLPSLLTGGDSGPALIPGAPDQSPLALSIAPHADQAPAMPQQRAPLSASTVDLIRRWIAAGAIDDSPPLLEDPIDAENPPVYARSPIVTAIAWSPDGALIAASGFHETLLFAASDGALVGRLIGRSERIESLAFSPDGSRLAVAGGSPARFGELQIWQVATRTLEHAESATRDSLRGVSFNADGSLVAYGCADRSVRAFDLKTKKQVLFNAAHDDVVLDTAFSTDGSHLVSVSRDRSLKLIKVATQQFIDNVTSITPGQTKGGLVAVERHPGADQALTGGDDGVPRLFKIYREQARRIGDDFNLLRAYAALPGWIGGLAFTSDGAHFAAVASTVHGGEVRVYDTAQEPPKWNVATPAALYAVAFRADGGAVACAGRDGVVRILDAASGATLAEFAVLPRTSESNETAQEETR